jgi:hypothetical protein
MGRRSKSISCLAHGMAENLLKNGGAARPKESFISCSIEVKIIFPIQKAISII